MKPFDELDLGKSEYEEGWLKAYEQKREGFLWKGDPIEFLPKYSDLFEEEHVHTILEAGCGDGRNLLYLLERGFFVTGLDISSIGLEKSLGLARQNNLKKLSLINGSIEDLPKPFVNDLFDAVTCLDVFGQILKIKEAISGFRMVTKPDGLILMNLYTPDDAAFGEGQKVGEKSFLYKKTLFRFFTATDIEELFSDFEILNLEHMRWEDPPHPGYRDYVHTHDSYIILLKNSK